MKKFIIILAAVFASVAANAQYYAGGSLGVSLHDNVADKFGFSIAPEVGYEISDNLAVGAFVEMRFGSKYSAFEIAPYVRYYFYELGPVRFFADGLFAYESFKWSGQSSQTSWQLAVCPGIAIPVTDQISIVTHLGAIGYNDDTSRIECDINPGARIGVLFAF